MSKPLTVASQHEIKAASTLLLEDVLCQTLIQSSGTLAYACILIRQKKYDLATHVLHSLEVKQASRFKDVVFYLLVQISIEKNEFARVKPGLVSRVTQRLDDKVALALLEVCIFEEWKAAELETALSSPSPTPSTPPATPAPVPKVIATDEAERFDFGLYQTLAMDANTLALAMGNGGSDHTKSHCRNPAMEPLILLMPPILPGSIADASAALECGEVHKICFSFQNLTVTSFHRAGERLDLITGKYNQSLLTLVRAENIFQKQVASALGRVGEAALAMEAQA